MGRATTMANMRHCTTLITLFFCALVVVSHATANLQSQWSILDTNGVTAPFEDGVVVEICPLEEQHVGVVAVVDAATIHGHTRDTWMHVDGSLRARMPMEIVRVDDGDRVVAVHTVELKMRDEEDQAEATLSLLSEDPPSTDVIECAFDPAFCTPKIVGIRLPNVGDDGPTLSVNHSIVLEFAAATNRPTAATRRAIEAFVAFPTYVGDELNGTWTDDKTLVIVVTALDATHVLPLQSLMEALVHTTLRVTEAPPSEREKTVRIQGDVRLRMEPLGDYAVRFLAEKLQSPTIRVRRCGDPALDSLPLIVILSDVTLRAMTHTPSDIVRELALPEPSVCIDGVLSHSGDEAFTLRHSALQIQDPGSWSLNLWLFTNQDPTGNFRALFFNGDGSGQHRTASAWFRPDDRRIVLRVSTAANMDVGLDSASEIPQNEWVNIGVTLQNCSTGVDANSTVRPNCNSEADETTPPPWLYKMKLFVNGKLDQEVRIGSPVLPNNGPFHLAKSPWTDGFRGFTSQVRTYSSTIRDADHHTLYTQSRSLYRSYTTKEMCKALENPRVTSPLPPVQQITYWSQCLLLRADPDPEDEKHARTAQSIAEDTTAASMYLEALRLRSLCNPTAWDLLVEAAELGDPRALCDIGTAFVYGRLAFSDDECVKTKIDGVMVPIDHEKAKDLLLKALHKNEWGAARPLALIHTHNHTHSITSPFQIGLFHIAAAAGRKDAFMVLGRLYSPTHKDVAAYHYLHAASDAAVAYHAHGKQPLHEMNRLYDGIEKEDDLRKGQLGDNDELIQYQKMRADKDGDVAAMASMGDLYYWGTRGHARDHTQAYSYYQQAAERGHTNAQSAVAGMLLKGEGTRQDNASAVAWYEKAAINNHTRALNGLGFIHFYGSGGLVENKTHALALFERAAANMEDGDSVFNAGYCHAFGLGTARNLTRAMQYYETAARTFGHFDAIHELGKLHWSGWEENDGVHKSSIPRDSGKAITYLKAASEAGFWGVSVRTGFEYYLTGDYERATVVYAEATEYGYGVATSNLAYLYDQKLLQIGDITSEQRALHHLQRAGSDKETLVRIGDFYYYGMGGLPANAAEALKWYSRASANGVDAGAYNVGHMHEHGLGVPINYERAERYYQRVLELAPPDAMEKQIVVQLALVRLRIRRWMERSALAHRLFEQGYSNHQNDHITRLPSLPGQQDREHETIRSIVTLTSVAMAVVVASLGVWLVRRRV